MFERKTTSVITTFIIRNINSSCPLRIRTSTNRTKICCATITPIGINRKRGMRWTSSALLLNPLFQTYYFLFSRRRAISSSLVSLVKSSSKSLSAPLQAPLQDSSSCCKSAIIFCKRLRCLIAI